MKLTGTEKQIKYANDLRNSKLLKLKDSFSLMCVVDHEKTLLEIANEYEAKEITIDEFNDYTRSTKLDIQNRDSLKKNIETLENYVGSAGTLIDACSTHGVANYSKLTNN